MNQKRNRQRTQSPAHMAIVEVLRSATSVKPITEEDIVTVLLSRGFGTEQMIRNTVPWVLWTGRSDRVRARQDRALLFREGERVQKVSTRPPAYYVAKGQQAEAQDPIRPAAKDLEATEGACQHLVVERKARSRWLASERKKQDEFRCAACKRMMEDLYGTLGKYIADGHHLIWPSRPGQRLVPMKELITLCPNRHRTVHVLLRKNPAVSIEQGLERVEGLRRIIELQRQRAGTMG